MAEQAVSNPEMPGTDPRLKLMNKVTDFFLRAFRTDEDDAVPDTDTDSHEETRPVGTTSSTENGFIKILLQPPAGNYVFHEHYSASGPRPSKVIPAIWLLAQLPIDGQGELTKEEVVLGAEEIWMYVVPQDEAPQQFSIAERHFKEVKVADTLPDFEATNDVDPTFEEINQCLQAEYWLKRLGDYNLRTFSVNDSNAPKTAA